MSLKDKLSFVSVPLPQYSSPALRSL